MDIQIAEYVRFITLALIPFMLAITVHEYSHGLSAYMLGDDTAKRAGRLTLNPLSHIDPLGILFLLVTRLFGWAKPVPVNFGRLEKNSKYGPAIVSFAGPFSNLLLAIISAVVLHFVSNIEVARGSVAMKILVPVVGMLSLSVRINIALFVFNLLPIPPLDGGRIVQSLLPYNQAVAFSKIERYGFIILIVLFLTRTIDAIIIPIIRFFLQILL
ncbi:peptidase M50 [Denitrovibrio acetiphilus DSM 12809]|uniref:Peptidase M50 n=1 Tax=Denitrovibrio acetiphilus (strain DSM 12809 / NBRC 114555 / N2460) TaxID=522772 RepID=D4H7Y5_DENA2|nr:site-2 protease family protein [Denitrovibrio acetiphilus]ADD68134.1 peptidase M50 [Denitrovibrio acetiphilus DSM 12809]